MGGVTIRPERLRLARGGISGSVARITSRRRATGEPGQEVVCGFTCSEEHIPGSGACGTLLARDGSLLVATWNECEADRLAGMIRKIRVALLTTVDLQGRFHTRPVQTLQIEGRIIWFFTGWSSPKVGELDHDHRVSLGYADPGNGLYLAVSGVANLLRDAAKARKLWTAEQRAYYPAGPADRRLALLRVRIEHAEYWVAPGRVAHLVAAAKSAVTGRSVEVIGKNHRIH